MTAHMRGIDRRQALALTISAAAFTAAPAAARVAARTPATRFAGLLAQFSEELLKLSPETATSLGLDTGARAALRSQIAGGSPADEAKFAGQVRSMLSRLGALNRGSLSPADQIRYDTVKYAAERGVEGTSFFYGSAAGGFFGGAAPYPVTQQDGAITSIPEFLNSQHPVNNSADAEAYLARVARMATILDDENAQISRDAARGVMPPNSGSLRLVLPPGR